MKTVSILLILLLASCTAPQFNIHTDYLSRRNLASYRVGTPDPLLNDPPIGQRLIISWVLPTSFKSMDNLHLSIAIIFHNGEQIAFRLPLRKTLGTYVYSLIDDDYFDKEGILTYKVELFGDEMLWFTFRHQLWTERILLNP